MRIVDELGKAVGVGRRVCSRSSRKEPEIFFLAIHQPSNSVALRCAVLESARFVHNCDLYIASVCKRSAESVEFELLLGVSAGSHTIEIDNVKSASRSKRTKSLLRSTVQNCISSISKKVLKNCISPNSLENGQRRDDESTTFSFRIFAHQPIGSPQHGVRFAGSH